ncbi:MAG: hypothetical protein VBE63_26705 [Lamprobacter sp.]|uniref:hypothetical protein n=1 Tax=Lamprobacter sp. TaxID=3100796 RepID=UPI002B256BB3|nr:hypothetical protein [Lamprobacter sp.]MEA3643495.1 hypothetical protein [Lamprobacter sp.]
MTIKTRLWSLVTLSVLALFFVFVAGKMGLDKLEDNFTHVVDQRIPMLSQSQEILQDQISAQRDVREMLLV